jgi:N-acetylmuramoyl-L-alanine amidase
MWCRANRYVVAAWLLAGLIVALAAPRLAMAGAVVTDLRVGHHSDVTRLVLDIDHQVRFNVFTLTVPDRVVVDLSEVGWRLPSRPLPERTGLLQSLRYGLFKSGTSRLVLDVTQPVEILDAYLLKPEKGGAFRLVLDLVERGQGKTIAKAPIGRKGAASRVEPNQAVPASRSPSSTEVAALPIPVQPRKPTGASKRRVIVLDPGHGGVDPGATSISGIYEKRITLAVAHLFKKKLEGTGRYRVILTRERDIFVRLRDRVRFARDAGAELFISLHADTVRNRKIRGLAVYTLSERASDREAGMLAEKENKSDLIAGIDLSGESREVTNILIDLAQRESMNQSARFASRLVKELARESKLLRNTHRFAGFAVLKAPDIPSVLLELGFLSNPKDERALKSRRYRNKLAAALTRGVDRYFARVEEAARR